MDSASEAVETLARAAGLMHDAAASYRVGWHLLRAGGEWNVWRRHSPQRRREGQAEGVGPSYLVDAPTALLAVLLLTRTETLTSPPMPSEAKARAWGEVTRPVSVRAGRCSACVARSGKRKLATVEWRTAKEDRTGSEHFRLTTPGGGGWTVRSRSRAGELVNYPGRSGGTIVCSRPCPDCHGTGERWAEVGRLVLDAAPRPASPFDQMFARISAHPERWDKPGDPVARDTLAVWADERLAAGVEVGRLVAEWLAWDRLDDGARERWVEAAASEAMAKARELELVGYRASNDDRRDALALAWRLAGGDA